MELRFTLFGPTELDVGGGMDNFAENLAEAIRQQDPAAVALFSYWSVEPLGGARAATSAGDSTGIRDPPTTKGGAADPLAAMLTGNDPATFMPPGGAVFTGAARVAEAQVEGARAFGPESTGHFEFLNSGS